MKSKRIIVSGLLLAVLAFALLILPISAEDPPSSAVAISVTSTEGYAGDTVTVSVALEENTGLSALRLALNYSDGLTLKRVSEKGLLGKWFVADESISEQPYELLWITNPASSAEGTLVELTFAIASDAKIGDLNVTVTVVQALDGSGQSLLSSAVVQNGVVTVKCRHSFGVWQKLDETEHCRQCSICQAYEYREHGWRQTAVHANGACDEAGTVDWSCSYCEATKTTAYQPSAGHSYTAWTDQENGEHTRRCAVCSKVVTEAHAWDTGTLQADPPCDEEGTIVYTCLKCGVQRTEEYVPTGEHAWEDCVSAGKEFHVYRCAVCKKLKSVAHIWDAGVVNSQIGCDENAKITYTCTDCGESKVMDHAPTEAHRYGAWNNADQNTHQHTCSACRKVETAAHQWEVTAEHIAGVCDENGTVTYTCTDCGATKVEAYTPTAAHAYGDWAQSNSLLHKHTCTVCGKNEIKEHNWDEGVVNVRGACDEEGTVTYTCRDCGAGNVEKYLPTASHQYGAFEEKDAYLHEHTCSVCQKTEITEHDWVVSEEKIEAPCDENGTVEMICSDCEATYIKPYVPTESHSFGAWESLDEENHERSCANCGKTEKAAHTRDTGTIHVEFCGGEGTIEYTCTGCGDKKIEDYVSDVNHTYRCQNQDDDVHAFECIICHSSGGTAPHNWDSGTVNAKGDCDENGTVTYTCTDCGATKVTAYVPTVGHSYGAWEKTSDLEHIHTCTACGRVEKREHTWDSGTVNAKGDCDENAHTLFTCTECGAEKRLAATPAAHIFGEWRYQAASKQMERVCDKCQKREFMNVTSTPPASSGGVQILPDDSLYFPAGTELRAEKITDEATFGKIASMISTVDANGTAIAVYDIALITADPNMTVSGERTVSVSLNSGELSSYGTVSVYYVSDSGKLYACPTSVEDGAVCFTTLFDGRFVIVGSSSASSAPPAQSGCRSTVAVFPVMGLGAAAAFLFTKKKKEFV